MHVERTLTVPRPIEAVFDYLADFTHTNDWDPGTVETRRTSGDGGVGTTYANTSEFMGRKTELTYETIAHERPAPPAVPGHQQDGDGHRHDDLHARLGRHRHGDPLPGRLRVRVRWSAWSPRSS